MHGMCSCVEVHFAYTYVHRFTLTSIRAHTQAIIKQTTTVTAMKCLGSAPTSSITSTVVKIEPAPILKISLTFASAPSKITLKETPRIAAATMNIDVRRIDVSIDASTVQLNVVTISYEDAMSLRMLCDSSLLGDLNRENMDVQRLYTSIVEAVAAGNSILASDGLSRDAVIGLAVGLGAGVPLVLISIALCLYRRQMGEKKRDEAYPITRTQSGRRADICFKTPPNHEHAKPQSMLTSTILGPLEPTEVHGHVSSQNETNTLQRPTPPIPPLQTLQTQSLSPFMPGQGQVRALIHQSQPEAQESPYLRTRAAASQSRHSDPSKVYLV